ncbi:MAG TPA: hypothetical protein PKJ85_11070 [Nitrosomonas nitrosa]|nr:hypothetical protein [Nitrosomonas nitrosa]
MNKTRRRLIKGMFTSGTLLAFGIPVATQAASTKQTFLDDMRNCQLLLGNTLVDEAFASGAQTAFFYHANYRQGTLPAFKLENELLTNPLHVVDLLAQSRNMRWITVMDHGSAAIFTELVRNLDGRLMSLGSHISSDNNASILMRHVWTTASPMHSAGGLLASLLIQNQHEFSIVENFLEQAVGNGEIKNSLLAEFSSYRLVEQPTIHLHCTGVSPPEASQLIGWKESENWESLSSQSDKFSINQNEIAADEILERPSFDNWVEATGYAVVATALGLGIYQQSCSSRAFVRRSNRRYPDLPGLSGKHFVSFVIDV